MRACLRVLPLALLLGCNTQLWPGPMQSRSPLPPGVDGNTDPGTADVLLLRHADPVELRRPPSTTAFPLTFFRKRQRVGAGSWVHCGAGGRAELLWTADGANTIVFDHTVCRLGNPDLGEPTLRFSTLTRVELELSPGAVVELPGGTELSGPPDGATGPYLVEQVYDEILRVFNRSKQPAYVAYRDAHIALAAGERIDLPLLGVGSAPFDLGGPPREVESAGLRGELYGAVELVEDASGLRASASGPGHLRGNGVVVALDAGGGAALLPLSGP